MISPAQADNIRSAVKEAWRSKKESELNGSDTLMVRYFAMSVAYARKFNIRNAFVAQRDQSARVLHGHHRRREDARVRHGDDRPDRPRKAGHI